MDQIYKRPDRCGNGFNADPERSYTIAAPMYFEPETLENEKRAIFWKSWIFVCHQSELSGAGSYVTAEIAGQRIFVVRGKDGSLRGFFNVCQHRGHSLLKGKGTAKPLLVCPYHAWSYDHEGKLQAAPNCAAVRDFDKASFSLAAVKVETFAGFVYVNLDPDARPMAEVYAGAEERLREFCPQADNLNTSREVVFDIKGNWKNVGDNLLECYHCGPAHKAFVDLVEMDTYKVETYKYWSIQYGDCRPDNSAFDYTPGKALDSFVTLFMWPNLAFVKFPGTDGLATFHFTPLEPELTHQSFTYHAPAEALTDTETRAFEYFQDVLGPEDVGLVEDVQQGLHSLSYHQGRFVIDAGRTELSEHAVHHFQNLVMDQLEI